MVAGYQLIPQEGCTGRAITILPGESVILGRGGLTGIEDKRLSRRQAEVTVNVSTAMLTALGLHPIRVTRPTSAGDVHMIVTQGNSQELLHHDKVSLIGAPEQNVYIHNYEVFPISILGKRPREQSPEKSKIDFDKLMAIEDEETDERKSLILTQENMFQDLEKRKYCKISEIRLNGINSELQKLIIKEETNRKEIMETEKVNIVHHDAVRKLEKIEIMRKLEQKKEKERIMREEEESKKRAFEEGDRSSSTSTTRSTCDASTCTLLWQLEHRVQFNHGSEFRSQPIKCRDGLTCPFKDDREHLKKYAHSITDVIPICKDDLTCVMVHLMHHRKSYAHTGLRSSPFECRNGMQCPQINVRSHLQKYAHVDPTQPIIPTDTKSSKEDESRTIPPSPNKLQSVNFSVPLTSVPSFLNSSTLVHSVSLTLLGGSELAEAIAKSKEEERQRIEEKKTLLKGLHEQGIPGLKRLCRDLGLKESGTLTELVERIKKSIELEIESIASYEDPPHLPPLRASRYALEPIPRDTPQFWQLEDRFTANLQGRNEDYVGKRIMKGQRPITFVMKAAIRVVNPTLSARFEAAKERLKRLGRDAIDLRERTSFHGSHPRNYPSILRLNLLRFKHPLNPCPRQVDDGFFGSNRKGVYVSRYADYALKYANNQVPLEPGQECNILMFKTLPGKSQHIPKLVGAIDPTEGCDSHSSPTYMEWFLFNEDQLCPEYVLTILAREDVRTKADDE